MSRLAGAGGAAESALMNAQAHAERSGGLREKTIRIHAISLQAKIRRDQYIQLFAETYISLGITSINANCR